MSEIPYYFNTPIPRYFRDNGWLQKPNSCAFITWCFERCSSEEREIQHDGQRIKLKPYQFIFGRRVCSEETGLTEDQVRTQLKIFLNANFIKNAPNKTPNRFTIYEWSTEVFFKSNPQQNTRLTPNRPPTDPHNLSNKNIRIKTTNQPNLPSKVVGLPVGESVGSVGGFSVSEDSKATGTEGSSSGELTNNILGHNQYYRPLTPESQELKKIYACLQNIPIKENDKARITAEFPEDIVKKAILHCTSADFKVKKRLDSSIFHYCKNPDQIMPTKEQVAKVKQVKKDNQEVIIANRKKICEKIPKLLVELLPSDKDARSRFRPNCESVEISNDRIKDNVFFNAPDFKNAVIHQMRKCELPIPDLVYEMA